MWTEDELQITEKVIFQSMGLKRLNREAIAFGRVLLILPESIRMFHPP